MEAKLEIGLVLMLQLEIMFYLASTHPPRGRAPWDPTGRRSSTFG